MSGIVLSASVRQNLLSLQSTAALLATTQDNLATGNKINTALDSPTDYFTAQGLNNRASDINSLLDGIGNGVQVLQAANTGITSLQGLVSSAQSIANQVLQTSVGYDRKSSVTAAAITGATVDNLLAGVAANVTFTGAAATDTTTTFSNAVVPTEAFQLTVDPSGFANGSSQLSTLFFRPNVGNALIVNGKTINRTASGAATTDGSGNVTIGIDQTLNSLLAAIDGITGNTTNPSSVVSSKVQINTGLANDITLGPNFLGFALLDFGLDPGTTNRGVATGTAALTGSTLLSGATGGAGALSAGFSAGNTITVDGQTLTFEVSGATGANQINVTDDVTTLLGKIDGLSGGSGSTVSGGKIALNTGTTSDLSITSNNSAALAALGLSGGATQARGGGLAGLTLDIGATGNGTATNITFGTGAGGFSTLNELNSALAANNLQASISSRGAITLTTTNNAVSSTIGAITGTAATGGQAFNGLTAAAPVADPNSQATRAGLVTQYNNVLQQINTTAQDSSFNGINLLNGDTLKLTFNETGASTLSITGVTFNDAGLGLSTLTAGTDFLDSNSANTALTALTQASSTLRSEASNLGSNLSIVQIRQNFNKNLINVLQTGSSNLTLADTNQEAANSQALSTRQSIAVSALSLANQSQQSVLQLLR